MVVSTVRGRRFVGGMGAGCRDAAETVSEGSCSHKAQGGFWVRPAKDLGALERLRLRVMGAVGLLGIPRGGLGQR